MVLLVQAGISHIQNRNSANTVNRRKILKGYALRVHYSIKFMAAHRLKILQFECDVTCQLFACGSNTDSDITSMKTRIHPARFEGVISNPSMSVEIQPLPSLQIIKARVTFTVHC